MKQQEKDYMSNPDLFRTNDSTFRYIHIQTHTHICICVNMYIKQLLPLLKNMFLFYVEK